MYKTFDSLGLSPVARARAGIEAANANKGLDMFKKLMEGRMISRVDNILCLCYNKYNS